MSKSQNHPYLMLGSLPATAAGDTKSKTQLRKILKDVIEGDNQGKILKDYVALGDSDLVLVVELPTSDPVVAMRTSSILKEQTGISFKSTALTTLKEYEDVVSEANRRIRIRIRIRD